MPAQQGFGADHDSRCIDLGLVMQAKFAAVDGLAQFALEAQAVVGAGLQAGLVEGHVVAPALFDLVHGHVGMAEEFFGVLAVAGNSAMPMLAVRW